VAAEVEATYNRESGVGGTYRFVMRPNIAVQLGDEAVTQAHQTIERRVNELGVAEPIVARHGGGRSDPRAAARRLGRLAREGDHPLDGAARAEARAAGPGVHAARNAARGDGRQEPPGTEVVPGIGDATAPGERAGTVYYLVQRTPVITGRDLRNARPTLDEYNQPAVSFSLKQDGAVKFGNATSANIGRQLAIILDGRVYSAPVIESRITDEGRISGRFTQQEAADLSLTLRSGALPASLTYLEERTVGPTLGADSIRAGVLASLTGLALVTMFLLFFYRLSGLNAVVAMSLNLVILMALMAYFGAVMTLPGIAGFILTIGMGVDSNVLIFERIKEELATQKGVRAAVHAGYDRVFLTIVDTHVSSLIAAAFLFQFGTGPIRGFATTLSIGLITNVFTSVFVSRTLFELVLRRRQPQAQALSI
jgi:preprotein translocase subunit SecD